MTLQLTEIIDYVMFETGQFIVGDISNILLDKNRFLSIIKRALAYYDRYLPEGRRTLINVPNGGVYYFDPDDAPEWISKCYPVGLSNPFMLAFMNASYGNSFDFNPVTVVYRYDKPRLVINNGFQVEVLGFYKRKIDVTYDTDGKTVIEATIGGVEMTDLNFLDLVKGYFLVGLGKSRRAFTIGDFPIAFDGDAMVQEGEEFISDATQAIQDVNRWYYAIGG